MKTHGWWGRPTTRTFLLFLWLSLFCDYIHASADTGDTTGRIQSASSSRAIRQVARSSWLENFRRNSRIRNRSNVDPSVVSSVATNGKSVWEDDDLIESLGDARSYTTRKIVFLRRSKVVHPIDDTVHLVSGRTKTIRKEIIQSDPNAGFFYGISPNMMKRHTTFTPKPRTKPLPVKKAMTLTLEEIRSMRLEMEVLREEIRKLKRTITGETEEEDTAALLAQQRKREAEFDQIGREVERWAEHLLFEQEGEVEGWTQVPCNKVLQASLNPDGRTVAYLKWMKDSRGSHANPEDDREYPCIKVFSTIDAPLDVVCQYLSDERKMTEYNDLVIDHKELEEISPNAKICWGQTPAILFIQPRDFLTFCHHRWLRDGTQVIVNQACDAHEKFVGKNPQAFALRGANYISPHPEDPSKTLIALLAHASPGPDVPHWASKTAVRALVPIEPFKLFAKINQGISDHREELEQALVPPETIHKGGEDGRSVKPAGMAQMGYACFWPQGGGEQED